MSENVTADSGKKQGFWAKVAADVKKSAEESKAAQLQARELAGNPVAKQSFGGYKIEIYDGGYVRVSNMLSDSTPYEKLKSIKHSFQVQDKSAGGRAMAGMMTGGVNYLASKEKRTVFLTIVTDKRVHTLKVTGGMTRGADKTALGLEVAGRGVLDSLAMATVPPAQVTAPGVSQVDVIEQIKKLGELYSAGVLSEEEFASKKADLLKRI